MTGSMAPRSSELVRVVDARALAWTAARVNEWRGERAPVAWARMTVGTTKATTRRRFRLGQRHQVPSFGKAREPLQESA